MNVDWEVTTLGKLIEAGEASLQTGPFGTALKAAEYTDYGVPLISVREIREGYFQVSSDTPKVSPTTTTRLPKFVLETGDIVFGRKGGVDRNAIIRPNQSGWFLGSDGIRLRFTAKYDSRFFSFQMRSSLIRAWLTQNCEGTTMPSLNQKVLARLPIVVPPLSEQKRLADILCDFDSKIQLNREINQTLEQIAQAIFKSWFVDFEPVKAKIEAKQNGRDPERAAMCAISGKTDEELDHLPADRLEQLAATAALFPDEHEDSELGEIPKGWEIRRIDEMMELSYGKALKKADRKPGNIPVYGSGGINGFHNKHIVEGPGIIVGRKGTVGSLHWEDHDFFPIDTVFYVVPKEKFNLYYIFYLLQTLGLKNMNTDAAVPGLNRNNVYRLLVPGHPIELINAYSNIISSFADKISTNKKEIDSLIEIRDTLLPKLLSGEITVADTQTKIKEAI